MGEIITACVVYSVEGTSKLPDDYTMSNAFLERDFSVIDDKIRSFWSNMASGMQKTGRIGLDSLYSHLHATKH